VQLYSSRSDDGWSFHQCSFGETLQTVVMIDYTEDVSEFLGRLGAALKVLGTQLDVEGCIHASYLDVSIQGMWNMGNFGGKIPCRSIWDASGKRLATVLILDTS
jgi:diphthine-ammonia ligase